MKATTWLDQLRGIERRNDWDALYDFRTKTNERFTRTCDATGLRDFYRAVAQIALPPSDAVPFINEDSTEFRSAIAASLQMVKAELGVRPEIRGVYFEYYFDGHDDESNPGDFFLCSKYSEDDDEWACEFDRKSGVIEGARLPHYMYLAEESKSESEGAIDLTRDEIANGLLLAAVLVEWEKSEIKGMPFALANHDHDMVRVGAI